MVSDFYIDCKLFRWGSNSVPGAWRCGFENRPLQTCLASTRHHTYMASRWLLLPVLVWLKAGSMLSDHEAQQILVPENNQKANCREGGGLREEQAFWAAAFHPKSLHGCKRNSPAPTLPPNLQITQYSMSMSVFVGSYEAFFFSFARKGR